MINKEKIIKSVLNKQKANDFLMGTVYSLSPFKVTLITGDTAIPAVMTTNLQSVAVGSRVLLVRFGNQFIAIAILGNGAIEKCILKDTSTHTTTTATYFKMPFGTGTTISDTLSMHSESTNNTRITVPTDGFYNISINSRFANSTSGSGRLGYIYVNNSQVNSVSSTFDSSGRSAFSTSINYYLSANDYVEFVVYQASGGDLNIGGVSASASNFSVIKI